MWHCEWKPFCGMVSFTRQVQELWRSARHEILFHSHSCRPDLHRFARRQGGTQLGPRPGQAGSQPNGQPGSAETAVSAGPVRPERRIDRRAGRYSAQSRPVRAPEGLPASSLRPQPGRPGSECRERGRSGIPVDLRAGHAGYVRGPAAPRGADVQRPFRCSRCAQPLGPDGRNGQKRTNVVRIAGSLARRLPGCRPRGPSRLRGRDGYSDPCATGPIGPRSAVQAGIESGIDHGGRSRRSGFG